METEDALVGSVLAGRYRVDSPLGEGTMCMVYLGEHLALHNKLAIKVLSLAASANEEAVRRFEREALAAANLAHPNIARAIDVGRTPDGRPFIALEYVEGRMLDAIIADGRMDPWRACRIAIQMLSALDHAHARGIIHRDIKPANVALVDTPDRGGTDLVKILDFGVAKLTGPTVTGEQEMTLEGLVYGTPDYLSPEQAMGIPVDHRADLYSVGVVLYEMLVGRRPFEAREEVNLLLAHVDQPPPPPSTKGPVPPGVEEVVMRLLAKSPDARFPDAQSVIEALDAAEAEAAPALVVVEPSEADLGAVAPEAKAPPRPPEKSEARRAARSRGPGLAIAVAAGAVAVLAGVWAAPYVTGRHPRVAPETTDAGTPAVAASTAAPSETPRTLEELEGLVAEHPNDAALRREIAAAHIKRRNLASAVPQYRMALKLDPSLKTDAVLQRHLVDALGSPFVWRQAADLLRDAVGESANDALFSGAVEDSRPRVRDRARQVLGEMGTTPPDWVATAFAIDDASTCEDRTAALVRAAELRDRRLLGPLRRRQRTPPRGDRACDPAELADAIRTLAALPR